MNSAFKFEKLRKTDNQMTSGECCEIRRYLSAERLFSHECRPIVYIRKPRK